MPPSLSLQHSTNRTKNLIRPDKPATPFEYGQDKFVIITEAPGQRQEVSFK